MGPCRIHIPLRCVTPGTLTDGALKPLTALTALTALDVFGVRLTDGGAALIGAHLPRLRQLEACGGGITGGLAVCWVCAGVGRVP